MCGSLTSLPNKGSKQQGLQCCGLSQ